MVQQYGYITFELVIIIDQLQQQHTLSPPERTQWKRGWSFACGILHLLSISAVSTAYDLLFPESFDDWLRSRQPWLVVMERPEIPNLGEMPSWLLICILQIAFQILLSRMGVTMRPVDFLESHGGTPCVFGTHHEFSSSPSPWYATNAGVSGSAPSGVVSPDEPSGVVPESHRPPKASAKARAGSRGLTPTPPAFPPPSFKGGKGLFGKGRDPDSGSESESVSSVLSDPENVASRKRQKRQ